MKDMIKGNYYNYTDYNYTDYNYTDYNYTLFIMII